MSDLGAGFWVKVVGVSLAAALGAILIFVFIGWAWYAWGLLGMLLFFAAVVIGIGYIIDRRDARRRGLAA
jgi:ABC-type Fe3+-siderophore transport system permease subunit